MILHKVIVAAAVLLLQQQVLSESDAGSGSGNNTAYCQSLVDRAREVISNSKHCAAVTDCCDVFRLPGRRSGIYWLGEVGGSNKVLCDMESSGGGWIVFARYEPARTDYHYFRLRLPSEVAKGFGELNGSFWYGLDKLHELTSSEYGAQLRIEVDGAEEGFKWAEYRNFSVGALQDIYKLHVSGYKNESTLMNAMELHNGALFSCELWDNDNHYRSCAANSYQWTVTNQVVGGGGWWYTNCCNACPFFKQIIFTMDHVKREYYDRIELKMRVNRGLCPN